LGNRAEIYTKKSIEKKRRHTSIIPSSQTKYVIENQFRSDSAHVRTSLFC